MKATAVVLLIGLAGCGSRSLTAADLGTAGDVRPGDGPAANDLPPACVGLEPYASGVTISPLHAFDALFLPDGRGLLLAAVAEDGAPAELSLELLGAGRKPLGTRPSLRSLEWLDAATRRVLLVEPLSSLQPYSLSLLDLGSGAIQSVAQNVCAHRVGQHGTLAFVEGCSAEWDGTLRVLFAGAGTAPVTIAKGVAAASLALSLDGKQLAFVSDVKHGLPGECGAEVGVLRETTGSQGDAVVAKEVLPRTVQYLAGRALLFQSRPGCGVPGGDPLLIRRAGEAPATIASGLSFGYGFSEELYLVSPDGRTLIGAKEGSATATQLVAVDLDHATIKVLADDLFSFHMTAMAFQPWRFTPTGGHLVYTTVTGYPQMGLATLATGSWNRAPLTNALSGAIWGAAPEGDAVAFVEGGSTSPARTLRLATLPPSGPGTELASFTGDGPSSRPSFLPGRERGLLFELRSSASVVELRRARRTGGATELLGSWKTSRLRRQFPDGSYRVHPSGCLVLFDSEQGAVLRSL